MQLGHRLYLFINQAKYGLAAQCWLWVFAVWAVTSSVCAAQQSQISAFYVYEHEEALYLDATVQLRLSENVREALNKGIALHFVMSAKVYRARWYWFDALEAWQSRSIRLSYQPLMQRYRVALGGFGQSFQNLDDALNFIGHIRRWYIADIENIASSGKRRLVFAFALDQTKLPRPFQIGDAIHSEWAISLQQEIHLPPFGAQL